MASSNGKVADALFRNLLNTISDVAVQMAHARAVKGRARSGYYRVAFLLTASMVEAVLHDYIIAMCNHDKDLIKKVRRMRASKGATALIKLHPEKMGTTKELWICEIDREKIDKLSSFSGMNDISLEMGIINKRLYSSLERIRKQRNEIHLQTLENANRKYTKQMVESAGKVFLNIIDRNIESKED